MKFIKELHITTKEISQTLNSELHLPYWITYPFWFIGLFLIFTFQKLTKKWK